MATNADSKAQQAGESASLAVLARVGLIAYGVVHLLIGGLALQLAWGASASKSADLSGALRTVADEPFGKILLGLVAVGLVSLALWQASETIWGYRNCKGAEPVRKQVTSGPKALFYAALAVSAASVALGLGSWDSQSQQQTTSGVLAWPAGRAIVVVAGLNIIGVGVAGVIKGVKKSFGEEIDTSSMSPVARKGVARLGQEIFCWLRRGRSGLPHGDRRASQTIRHALVRARSQRHYRFALLHSFRALRRFLGLSRLLAPLLSRPPIARRLKERFWPEQPEPMFAASNIHYEMAEKAQGITCGGMGAIHLMCRKIGLVDDLNEKVTTISN
jgi:hypothetical protein